ncbi:hypothetical protein ACFWHG_35865 [Streptomyces microflavus]|uniref:hypothetical protein n=1 Tax=Streptomyces microflavus TaxID=1919 RepID=UPI003662033D
MPGCDIVQKPFRGLRQQGQRHLDGELMAYGQERELQLAVPPLGTGRTGSAMDGRAGNPSKGSPGNLTKAPARPLNRTG